MDNDFVKIEYESSIIADIVSRIKQDKILLTYFQRDFVGDKERIYLLLDSLMRGYLIGDILIWETKCPVNYRDFECNYNYNISNNKFTAGDENNPVIKQYILDGQQCLQSLYIAMCGSYDGAIIFFNLKSSPKGNSDNSDKNIPSCLSQLHLTGIKVTG